MAGKPVIQARIKPSGRARKLAPDQAKRRKRSAISQTAKTKPPSQLKEPLAVVGIGASAGGLDPCRRFFTEMPAESGMAFVVVQHLDPDHKSEMAPLLGRCTRMVVAEAVDRVRVEPNHVYVIPPNRALAIRNGRLRLTVPAEQPGARMAIDFFFRSLAAECQERGIGIILSGTGSDGTLGLQAIKGASGLAIAQEPHGAEHEGMPRSAITRGVDLVLPVQAMPKALLKYANHPYLQSPSEPATVSQEGRDHFQSILALLRTRAKFDFGGYKRGTLHRRVQRRMNLRHVVRTEDYLQLLRRDNAEAGALVKDLLINVTHFFREPDAWETLQEQVIRPLIAAKSDDRPIRAWVPGCATGEEAYSLGMLILDELSAAGKSFAVNIFASDVNRDAFAIARTGVYPESIAAEVPPKRLGRYFVREGGHYRIRQELRDAIVFAEHNLLVDPPFSRLDLVSCRNVMIYLETAAQKRVIGLLHYALREGGTLFLGSAETVGDRQDLFRPLSRKWRLYTRIGTAREEPIEIPLEGGRGASPPRAANPPSPASPARFTELAQQLLLDRHAPACVVINPKHQILYTCGPTERFLRQPAGVMQTDLLSWLSESLRPKLRAALKKAQTTGQAVSLPDVRLRRANAVGTAEITVEPVQSPRQADGLILITFRSAVSTASATAAPAVAQGGAEDESLVHQLEDELKTTREDLQSNIDQLAASNEELKASNEEVTSGNEELQSTNEELETSKEELQSLNEELSTVNSQLQAKVDELESKTNDLNNLLTSTDIATIFLDRRFQIKWFTTPTTKLLRLRPADIGRPIADFAQKFTGGDLRSDAKKVLQKLTPIEREVRNQEGRWYLRRALPYRTADNRIDGVVVTFVDIHNSKIAEEKLRLMAAVLRDCNDAVTVQGFDGRILAWNRGAELMYGYTETEALRRNGVKLVPRARRAEMLAIFKRLKRGEKIHSFEIQRQAKDGSVLDVWLTMSALLDDDGERTAVATTERDITQRKRDETALRELNQSLEKRVTERTALAEQQAQRLRELAVQLLMTEEQERRNLAADLHDNLSQLLHVAKLKLLELRSVSSGNGSPQLLPEIELLLDRANQAARSLSYQLSPPVLHELGLVPALEWLGEEMNRLYRLDVTVIDDSNAKPLDERIRIVLFRAVRELLVNIAKHAGVHRAHVQIRRKGNQVTITVVDHGVGFDPKVVHDPKKTRGFGLFNIRERLDYLGGRMEIQSTIGKKTTITLRMPVVMEGQRVSEA